MKYLRELRRNSLSTLNIMRNFNQQYTRLDTQRQQIEVTVQGLALTVHNLKVILDALKTRRAGYYDTMVDKLKQALRYSIEKTSRNKVYDIALIPSLYRGENIFKLYFVDEAQNLLPPKTVEGDMLNQVLSFSAITIISHQSGFSKVYYDEAFASANVRSLVVIRELIQEYSQLGITFVFVTQSPMLLAGIDRKVVELVSGEQTISKVLEYTISGTEYSSKVDMAVISLFDKISEGSITDESFTDTIRELSNGFSGEGTTGQVSNLST